MINLKSKKKEELTKLYHFCKENGADKFDEEYNRGYWIMPKRYGDYKIAIQLKEDGKVCFKNYLESTKYFTDTSDCTFYIQEQNWIVLILKIISRYRK